MFSTSAFLTPEFTALFDADARARVVILPDHRIAVVNQAYRKLFPNAREPVGQTCFQVSHGYALPCEHSGESCPMKAAAATRQTQKVLHIHQTARGSEHVEIETVPIYDARGQLAAYIETLHTVHAASAQASGQGLIGRSAPFQRMLDLITRVAPTQAAVLLLGESGTGKELAARAVHDHGERAHRPFVTVECAGLSETLFENEVFGHEKGAFTGAHARKPGLIESATGGTLFLDEVGDIPLTMQVKLLRVLETGTYRRVGGVEPLRADFRLVCATHRDLPAMVEAEQFRRDLYYRINTFPINLPPLRERRQDLPLLVAALLRRIAPHRQLQIDDTTLACLAGYDFPGNIRELRNILERAVILADGDALTPETLTDACQRPPADSAPHPETPDTFACARVLPLQDLERRYLAWASEQLPSRRHLAQALDVSERTLFRKLQKP
jgi:DNA-binding NtrC family response regulator